MASDASALKVTRILFVGAFVVGSRYAGMSREGANRSGSVMGVPEKPVAEQNARYSGTAA